MAFDTIGDIIQAVSNAENETGMVNLRTRMTADFDLLTLLAYEPKDTLGKVRKGYQSSTSSAPRNFFDKIMDGLNRAVLTIQIKLAEDAKEKERRDASVGELFLFGALNEIDRKLLRRGEPPLRESLGFYMCLRGWYVARALVYLPKGKTDTEFDVVPWDPLHTTWAMGPEGLLWAAHKRRVTRDQIKAEYGISITSKEGDVIDFWDAERNSVVVDKEFGKEPTAHEIGHVPVLVGSVGSMPAMQDKEFLSAIEWQGDSVWAASRDLYESINKFDSWVMDMASRAVAGSLVHASAGGLKGLTGDPYVGFQELRVDSTMGETITPLELVDPPAAMAAVRAALEKDLQQSTLPYPLAFGGTEEAMSGRALSVLADATRSVYSPRTRAMARVYTWLCEELLAQYAQKGIKERELMGYNAKGDFFQVKVKPSVINTSWFVGVKVEPRLPRDEEKEIAIAMTATQKRGPDQQQLMSMDTAREEILKLRDPDAEKDKVLAEMGESLPPIVAANVAAALKRRGKDELAEQVMMLLAPGQAQGAGPGPGPVAPTNGAQPARPVQGRQQGRIPPELQQVLDAVIQALIDAGDQTLVQELIAVLQGQGQMTAQLIEGIMQTLVQNGQQELAAAFLSALGLDQQQAAPAQPAGAGV